MEYVIAIETTCIDAAAYSKMTYVVSGWELNCTHSLTSDNPRFVVTLSFSRYDVMASCVNAGFNIV